MTDRTDLKRKLSEAGLGSVAERIMKLARPCYRIGRTLAPEEQIPVGASKFGGSPDVPADFVWPQISNFKKPEGMEFVGQVRLADLPEPFPAPVPRDGLLSFFTRWSEGRVFYFLDKTPLQRTPVPPMLEPPGSMGLWARLFPEHKRTRRSNHPYRSCLLKAFPELSLPDGGSSVMKELNLSEEDLEAYFELGAGMARTQQPSETTQHQMFGYSSPVQNEMELECEAIRRGDKMRWDVQNEQYIAATRDWILLLQVDTDDYKEGPGWMWGDAGMVYFWIHRDDLAARAFDKTITIEQCH